jgi:hypothetical protein
MEAGSCSHLFPMVSSPKIRHIQLRGGAVFIEARDRYRPRRPFDLLRIALRLAFDRNQRGAEASPGFSDANISLPLEGKILRFFVNAQRPFSLHPDAIKAFRLHTRLPRQTPHRTQMYLHRLEWAFRA